MHRQLAPSEKTLAKKVSDVCLYPRNWVGILHGGVQTQQCNRHFPRLTHPAVQKPEPYKQGPGLKWITSRATVSGDSAWGRGKPSPAQCQNTAREPPTHYVGCRRHVLRSIACRCAPRRNPISQRPRSRQKLVDVVVEAVVYAVDVGKPSVPACPLPMTYPSLSEARHPV